MDAIMQTISSIRLQDVLDIVIIAFCFYKLLMLIKETRAEQLIKGIIILLVVLKLSEWAKLYTVYYILKNTVTLGFVALLILFQPELRRALEYIGRSKFLSKSIVEIQYEELIASIESIVDATVRMSKNKIGALIVLERETGISEIMETGIKIGGQLSDQLLENIFVPNTPLHDGAVTIRENKIMAAGCILPLSENQNISKELGTRHRAGLGMAESSDAVVVIVSEETGGISVAKDGKLSRFLDANTLKRILIDAYNPEKNNALIKRRWRVKDE